MKVQSSSMRKKQRWLKGLFTTWHQKYDSIKSILNSRAGSSVGRAPALQAGGHRFNPCSAYQQVSECGIWIAEFKSEIYNLKFKIRFGGVVQLVRAPACHAGGCGFEPRRSRQKLRNLPDEGRFLCMER